MICPTCNNRNIKFECETSWGIPWKPFKDHNGKIHKHDPNKHFQDFKCQNGHIIVYSYFPNCNCGWKNKNV